MLNEARRIEAGRDVSGVAWRLTAAGRACLLATGIRRLVDGDQRADSLTGIIQRLRGGHDLLTQRHYVEAVDDANDWEEAKEEYMRNVIEPELDDTKPAHAWASGMGPWHA